MKIHLWFGYDPKTYDYKVVKLTVLYRQPSILPEVEVYSMIKGLWELISQRFPSNIIWICDQDEVCVDNHDGRLHWLGYTTYSQWMQTIVAFNLSAKTFLETPLPDSILKYNVYRSNVLGVLAGKVCLMSRVIDGECEVWVMDEYGVAESWVKHHVFSQFRNITPYRFTLQNEFLYEVDDRFALCDPVKAKNKTFKIRGGLRIAKIVDYVKSLVWVAPART